MDLLRLERELKKRCSYPYNWGRKQADNWDIKTNFIYTTYSFSSLKDKCSNLSEKLRNYAYNRWLNFWSAQGVEYIFSSHKNVIANENKKDKLVDFTIDTISFDHKTSVFPKGFNNSFEYAKNNTKELITWLYENQSQQGRKHLKSRLFVVLFDSTKQQHWKLKSEILMLKKKIDIYISNFNKNNLLQFSFENETVFSDIIWVIR